MKTNYIQRLGLGMVALCVAVSAQAGTVFQDDFEGGLGQWTGKGTNATSAHIIADPTPGSTHGGVVEFATAMGGGDLFSKSVFAPGVYQLTFDYFGVGAGAGGFIGAINCDVPTGILWGTPWLAGSGSPAPTALLDNGAWNHYVLNFTTTESFKLVLEDFTRPGDDARFDNLSLTTTVPEGGQTAVLLAASCILFAAFRARMKSSLQ